MGVYKLEKSEEEVTVLVGVGSPEKAGYSRGKAAGMRAAKSSESMEKRIVSTINGPIWNRSIALTCPARSHFQRTLNRERRSHG